MLTAAIQQGLNVRTNPALSGGLEDRMQSKLLDTFCERCEYNLSNTGALIEDNIGKTIICPKCAEPHIVTRDYKRVIDDEVEYITAYAID